MNGKRLRSSVKGFIAYFYIMIITTILPFVIRTLTIYCLGIEYAGVGNLFSSILSIINMADLGIDSAILFYMHKPYKIKNKKEIDGLLNIFRCFYLIVGIFIILFGSFTVPIIDRLILNSQYPADINLKMVYYTELFFLVGP